MQRLLAHSITLTLTHKLVPALEVLPRFSSTLAPITQPACDSAKFVAVKYLSFQVSSPIRLAPCKVPHNIKSPSEAYWPACPRYYFVRTFSSEPELSKGNPNGGKEYHQQSHSQFRYLRHRYISLVFSLSPVYITAACLVFIYCESLAHDEPLHYEDFDMGMEIPPGRPGNLTPEQEEKLRQLWSRIFQLCNVGSENQLSAAMAETTLSPTSIAHKDTIGSEKGDKPKKKRLGIFSRSKNASSKDVSTMPPAVDNTPMAAPSPTHPASAPPSGRATPLPAGFDTEDKYGQTKEFLDALEKQSPESIRETIWSMVKHDHPDHLVLRFLRARKWDVDRALVMFISTINWRHEQVKVDSTIMKEGELTPVEGEKSADTPVREQILYRDFMAQVRMGKSFLHGVDKQGRPICLVRVRLHKAGEQCEDSLERYTVYLIETARMLLAPPIDTAVSSF